MISVSCPWSHYGDTPPITSDLLPQGILEGQTCTPTAPEPLAAILWAIFAVFGIVYALLGYRCLRAVGFLSGLLVGANGIFILQDFQITFLGKPADSALAIVAGLLGAVLGSTYPVASVLISAFAGALLSGAAMAVCVATFPDNEFGVSSSPHCFACTRCLYRFPPPYRSTARSMWPWWVEPSSAPC